MSKYLLVPLFLVSTVSFAANIPESFDTRPVLPTVEKMRNVTWTWDNFASLPNMGKLERDGQSKNRYTMTQTIRDENPQTTITFYGTRQRPEVAVIEARTWGAANTQSSRFVRLGKLKGNIPLTSNCNFKDISISENYDGAETGATLDFQQAYMMPKNIASLSPAKDDLYLASSQVESFVITSTYQTQAYTISIVTPEKKKLGQFINSYGWDTSNQDKKVTCNVS